MYLPLFGETSKCPIEHGNFIWYLEDVSHAMLMRILNEQPPQVVKMIEMQRICAENLHR